MLRQCLSMLYCKQLKEKRKKMMMQLVDFSSVEKTKILFKIICFILFTLICFAQCYSILSNFFQYPVMIDIYDSSPSLITILPGITVCNNNRISLRKLLANNETFRQQFRQKFPRWYETNQSIIDTQEFNKFRDDLSELFAQLDYNPHEIFDNSSINQWFEFHPMSEKLIEWLGCAKTWQDSMDCSRMTRIDSVTNRLCTTLLHRGAMLYDKLNKPELFNNETTTSVNNEIRGLKNSNLKQQQQVATVAEEAEEISAGESLDSLQYFDAKEVVKMVLNFEPEDYGDLRRQIGARIIFHDNDHVASTGDLDFYVSRGFRYDFNIDRKDFKLLKEPYFRCSDYDEMNLKRFEKRVEPREPLGENGCFQNCVVRNVLRRSKCWPQSMPYFRNDSLDPDLQLKSCRWFRGSRHFSLVEELIRIEEFKRSKQMMMMMMSMNSNVENNNKSFILLYKNQPKFKIHHDKMRAYHKIRRFCWERCMLSCKMSDFTVTVTRSVWPSDVKVLLDKSGREQVKRHCCALIALKFTHYHYNINEFKPKLDVANTIGDLSGLLAVWLGLSIVSIYHAIQRLVGFCTRRSLLLRSQNILDK